MPEKILFISHDATRTGAPLVLLSLCRWLRQHTAVDFEILLLAYGPLLDDFKRVAPTFVVEDVSGRHRRGPRIVHRLLRRGNEHWLERTHAKLAARGYTAIYGNTIVTIEWLLRFKAAGHARCVCAVHEMSWVIERYFSRDAVTAGLARLDTVVAAGNAVATTLERIYGVPRDKLFVLDSYIDTQVSLTQDANLLRARLGIEPGDTVIVGSGSGIERKGVDLLLPMCRRLAENHPDFRFKLVWVGGRHTDESISMARHDAEKLGLSDRMVFVESTPHPDDYIALGDIFVLPSREEALGLVVLTAALLEKPIVAFEGSGGMDEFLAGGAGVLVRYLDVAQFADTVHRLALDPAAASAMGRIGHARVLEHHDAAVQGTKFCAFIEAFTAGTLSPSKG